MQFLSKERTKSLKAVNSNIYSTIAMSPVKSNKICIGLELG